MEKEMYKSITENLVKCLPDGWEKVCTYIQVSKNSYEVFFHVKIGGKYIQCFNLEKDFGIKRNTLRESFKSIAQSSKDDQAEKKWYVMTFLLSADGKFSVEYEYTDYSETSLDYMSQWKNKYLV